MNRNKLAAIKPPLLLCRLSGAAQGGQFPEPFLPGERAPAGGLEKAFQAGIVKNQGYSSRSKERKATGP